MQTPAAVSFQDVPVSEEVEAQILARVEELERFYERITACRVVVSTPHRRRRKGQLYSVRIDLSVPGEEIVVNRDSGLDHAHEDLRVAVHDAFAAARRRLQDHVRRARGFVKHHERPFPEPQGASPGPAPAGPAAAERASREVLVPAGGAALPGLLTVPHGARALVVFAQGREGRRAPGGAYVADVLHSGGLASLRFDPTGAGDVRTPAEAFDLDLATSRLAAALHFVRAQPDARGLPLGLYGATTGAAAALGVAAADPGVGAVVVRGGRVDLASDALPFVAAPTLLVVGGADSHLLALHRAALARLHGPKELAVVPGATNLFQEPGTSREAARLARDWFLRHLLPPDA